MKPKTDAHTYSSAYLTAGSISLGFAQTTIALHVSHGKILHSAHTVRDKDGEDVLLLIFQDAKHAEAYGTQSAPIPNEWLSAPKK